MDSSTGTFLSVDPLVAMTGMPYLYGNGNPATFSDPTGLYAECADPDDPCHSRSASGRQAPPKLGPAATAVAHLSSSDREYFQQLASMSTVDVAGQLPLYNANGGAAAYMPTELNSEADWQMLVYAYLIERFNDAVASGAVSVNSNGGIDPENIVSLRSEAMQDVVISAIVGMLSWSAMQRSSGGTLPPGMTMDEYLNPPKAGPVCNSFDGDTLVLMADGSTKRIRDVELGDVVLAVDPETGERGARQVVRLIRGEGVKDLVDVTIRTDHGEAVIEATEGHPFWVDRTGAWVDAGDLQPGDLLLSSDGDHPVVTAVEDHATYKQVYNLTIDGIHTYHVIAAGEPVLVHNSGCGGLHGVYRGATRDVDIDFVLDSGDIYVQPNGRWVYVAPNSETTYSAVVMPGPSVVGGRWISVLDNVSQSGLAARIADGRWVPLGAG